MRRPTKKSQPRSLFKTSVWIIEDNCLFRKNLARLINGTRGMICSGSFGSCEDAIEKLATDNPPDVLLLDIGLPGMTGIEGIKRIKSLAPMIQIIMITVHDDQDNVLNAICAGATGYLLKTSPAEKIVEAIRDVLNGGSPINPNIARKVLTIFSNIKPSPADYPLTDREKEILELMVEGLTYKQISSKLSLSMHTIDTHIRGIYCKLQVHTRSRAVAKTLRERIL